MKTRLLGVLVEPSVYERLRVRAFEERVNISELIRRALARYLVTAEKESRKGRQKGGQSHVGGE